MIELGIESSVIQDILDGNKTVEGRLHKGKFLNIRPGDKLSLREDVWNDSEIVKSFPDKAKVEVTHVLYFESFSEMLHAIDFRKVIPHATTIQEALEVYRKFYSPIDEEKYGVIAFVFKRLEK